MPAVPPLDRPDRPEGGRPVEVVSGRPPGRGNAPLPQPLTSLVDRERELAAVGVLLRDDGVPLVTLTGPGGVGKTRLAIAAANAVAAAFADGIAFVRLALVADPGLVGPTIAHALGLRDMGAESPAGRLAGFLGEKRLLLLLDNFEQVVDAAPLVTDLLGRCPGLKALVTSRVRLRLSAEREYPVEPLALPPPARPPGDDGSRAEAVVLFAERARAVRPDFAVTAENAAAIREIVRRLDGLPLAVELAAARIKALPPAALLARLEPRLPLLTGGGRDLPRRQQTMRDTIAWSHDLLTPAEQALFRRLAVFEGGFTLEAVEAVGAVADGSPLGADDDPVVEGITSLVEQSLLRPVARSPGDPAAGDPRYAMLETVREYALERLTESSETEAIGGGHAAYFLALAEAAEPGLDGPAQVRWLDRLDEELPNLRAALAWATAHDAERALRLGGALDQFWRIRGHLTEGREALERALAAGAPAPATSSAARAKALVALSLVRYSQGDFAAGAALAAAARLDYERLGDQRGVATALGAIGYSHIGLGVETAPPDQNHFARAEAAFQDELGRWQTLGDADGVAWAIYSLGFLALNRGDTAGAAERLAEALPHFDALGDRWGTGWSLTSLGRVMAQQGDDGRAATLFGQALDVFRDLGDQWATAYTIEYVGWLAQRAGRAEQAARLLAAAAALRAADGIELSRAHRPDHDRAIVAARATLGEADFAAAWAAGRTIAVEAAIDEARVVLAAPAASPAPEAADDPAAGVGLTRREREVLRLLAEGRADREIAEALSLGERTVESHVLHILQKLGVDSRTAAAVWAVRHGLA